MIDETARHSGTHDENKADTAKGMEEGLDRERGPAGWEWRFGEFRFVFNVSHDGLVHDQTTRCVHY
jgi:hypothetical protein